MEKMSFTAPVIHGRRLGHTLGVPTVNQTPPEAFASLPRGVYFSRCTLDGVSYPAVSNLGVKPTVSGAGETALLCETHILGLDLGVRDLYGSVITTELCHFRRPEQKFGSLAELSDMLAADVEAAKEFFGT